MQIFDYQPPAVPWLDIRYKDRDLIIINKPSGLLSNPGRAAHTYKDKFGVWPKGLEDAPKTPSVEFNKAVKAALIRYLKGKK